MRNVNITIITESIMGCILANWYALCCIPLWKIAPHSTTHMSKLDIFTNPKFWAIHLGSPHCIALACYPWLILVINCKTEFLSFSYNYNSKAFWQKKVFPKQSILGWFKGIFTCFFVVVSLVISTKYAEFLTNFFRHF